MKRIDYETKIGDYAKGLGNFHSAFGLGKNTGEFELLQKKVEAHDRELKGKLERIFRSQKENDSNTFFKQTPTVSLDHNNRFDIEAVDPLLGQYEKVINTLQNENGQLSKDNLRLTDIMNLLLEDNSNLRGHIRATELQLSDILAYYSNLIRHPVDQTPKHIQ
jgi:hypothetical protein